MAVFTDTITLYTKVSDMEWKRTVVEGVQWADKTTKGNDNGKVSVARYAIVTFPEGTYENLILEAEREEDCIVCGEVEDVITGAKGSRVTDILEKYKKSGRLQSINDNSNRDFLKNKKVVIA